MGPSVSHLCRLGLGWSDHYLPLRGRDETGESCQRYLDQTRRLTGTQLSLEQVDEIFEAPNPKKRSFELFKEAKERAKFEKEQERIRQEGA